MDAIDCLQFYQGWLPGSCLTESSTFTINLSLTKRKINFSITAQYVIVYSCHGTRTAPAMAPSLPGCGDTADNIERQGGIGWQAVQRDACPRRTLQVDNANVCASGTDSGSRAGGAGYRRAIQTSGRRVSEHGTRRVSRTQISDGDGVAGCRSGSNATRAIIFGNRHIDQTYHAVRVSSGIVGHEGIYHCDIRNHGHRIGHSTGACRHGGDDSERQGRTH